MKLIALEDITCRYGEKNGFGTKLTGEVFEVLDDVRALEVIATGSAQEYKENTETKPKTKA